MYRLYQKDIDYLPIHDADFIKLSFHQDDSGDINIQMYVSLYEGEYEALHQYSSVIGSNGETCFLLKDCTLINYISYQGVSQRDAIDFVNISEISNDGIFTSEVKVLMVSGMKLSCMAKSVFLVKT